MGKFLGGVLVGTGVVVAVVIIYSHSNVLRPAVQGGFTDAQIREVEQSIQNYYLEKQRNSSSAAEREQALNGLTTVDAKMLKVSDRRLEGYVKFTLRDEESKRLGLDEIMLN